MPVSPYRDAILEQLMDGIPPAVLSKSGYPPATVYQLWAELQGKPLPPSRMRAKGIEPQPAQPAAQSAQPAQPVISRPAEMTTVFPGMVFEEETPQKGQVKLAPAPDRKDAIVTPQGQLQQVDMPALAQSLALQPRTMRMPVPEYLFTGMVIAMREFGWPLMSPVDFIDTVIMEFMRDRGFLLGGYFKVEDLKELTKIYTVSMETGEVKPIMEVEDAVQARTQNPSTAKPESESGG